ncbi:cupin domain-containing protein [[Phormidium] sp. ETS-05]|uniref:cupin domain-containing protein n=1 Tax=[Phormidium] sp. ETS-05 TaxID=222819 RepID=UPI0018EF2DC4|nr:cupin domain-containing protein [[Phormidium] sp. ETS-05]
MKVLSSLLYPYSLETFWAENWTKKAVLISSNQDSKFSHLFDWEQLNYLLNYHQINYPDLRFVQDGVSLPMAKKEQWLELIQQGATLIINGVHNRTPKLRKLAAQIRQETGYRSQINLYCSPRSEKGFNCHYDTHEVLILQIDGEKEWLIFPETIAAPVSTIRSSEQIPPDVPPYLQCILKPGDVLYIPRGHWHYAIACGSPAEEDYSPSLHLTLGIDCQTGLDWMTWLGQKLPENPEWRENLPLMSQADRPAVQNHLEKLRDRLIAWLQTPEAIGDYLDYLGYCDRPPLPFSFPHQLGSKIFDGGLDSRFICSQLHLVQILPIGENQTQIIIGSKQATIKGLPPDLVKNLFRPEGFTLLDLAEWAPHLDVETEVIPLLTRLVTQGILLVEPSEAIGG